MAKKSTQEMAAWLGLVSSRQYRTLLFILRTVNTQNRAKRSVKLTLRLSTTQLQSWLHATYTGDPEKGCGRNEDKARQS